MSLIQAISQSAGDGRQEIVSYLYSKCFLAINISWVAFLVTELLFGHRNVQMTEM